MTEIIEGNFHPYVVGQLVWKCSTCANAFCWGEGASHWGNPEYAFAVFCSSECAKPFDTSIASHKPVIPIGKIGPDRLPIGI